MLDPELVRVSRRLGARLRLVPPSGHWHLDRNHSYLCPTFRLLRAPIIIRIHGVTKHHLASLPEARHAITDRVVFLVENCRMSIAQLPLMNIDSNSRTDSQLISPSPSQPTLSQTDDVSVNHICLNLHCEFRLTTRLSFLGP